MKCKDIKDSDFLWAVMMAPFSGINGSAAPWRARWHVQKELEAIYGPLPEKLFLAKARKMGRKRLVSGCTNCTCRGDYHLWGECFDETCCPKPWDWEKSLALEGEVVCGLALASCICALPPHGPEVAHECSDKARCNGSWRGAAEGNDDFEIVRLPGMEVN